MARIWWDAFTYADVTKMSNLYLDVSLSAFNAAPRFASGGYSQGASANTSYGWVKSVTPGAEMGFGLAHSFYLGGYGPFRVMSLGEGTLRSGFTAHVRVQVTADGALQLARGDGTILYAGVAGQIVPSTWQYITASVLVDDTVGKASLTLDGVTLYNATNIDTRNGGTGVVNGLLYSGGGGNANTRYCDFYVDNTFGVLPERRVDVLTANGDGGTLNLVCSTGTSHFAMVDEMPGSTTDYLSGNVVGDLDLLDLTTLAYTPAAIDGVRTQGLLAKTDAATRQANIGIKSGATAVDGDTLTLNATPLCFSGLIQLTDPDTGVAWTKPGIDALQVRPRVAA